MFQELQLQVNIGERRSDLLRLGFTVVNQSDWPLYVFTCVAGSILEPLPHRAYTSFRDKDRSLHVFLGIPPIPAGVSVYAKVVPYSSLLRPGQSVSEYYELPIPVPEWQPYADPEEAEEVELVQASRLLVSTEFFGTENFIREPERDEETGYFKALGAPLRRVRAEVKIIEPIPVLKRLDEFERF